MKTLMLTTVIGTTLAASSAYQPGWEEQEKDAAQRIASVAVSEPAYTLEGDLLTVSGGVVVVVVGPGSELIEGLSIPAADNGAALSPDDGAIVWRLSPGSHEVTAFPPPLPLGTNPPTTWTVVVEPPPDPDRNQWIAAALSAWIAVAAEWSELNPTAEEVRDALLTTFRED